MKASCGAKQHNRQRRNTARGKKTRKVQKTMSTTTEIIEVTATEMANWLTAAKADALKDTFQKARQACKQGEAYKNYESKLARKDGALIYCPETGKTVRGRVKYSVIVEAEKVNDANLTQESED